MSVRVTYNSPLILSFTILSFCILVSCAYLVDLTPYLALPGNFDWKSFDYLKLISYTMVHATSNLVGQSDFSHFVGNFTIILLIGPVLEEKFGSRKLLYMMLFTAIVTGLLNAIFNDHGIIGASGLALMMVILGSFTNYKKGDLPLTFIIISLLFLGNEFATSLGSDRISHFAHILGGISGAIYGFRYSK